MERFLITENIRHYQALLRQGVECPARAVVQSLLAEEETKLARLDGASNHRASFEQRQSAFNRVQHNVVRPGQETRAEG